MAKKTAVLGSALWEQFGAAIDMLEVAMKSCPDSLWTERVWPEEPPEWFPRSFAEFWYVAYHSLVWLDLYMTGAPEADFSPPAPFIQGEVDSPQTTPERPYTKEQLGRYLTSLRERCHEVLLALTDEQGGRLVEYPWTEGKQVTYLELVLYNLRHVQGHAAQMSLFLGQRGVAGRDDDWVTRAR
ncbi:MAG TPA: DinB family protein [Candidatus Dormibacteraeota bacterium]|nr:DinB family protein [Candidatus Dormibacteraeota bacterium]